MRTIVLFMALSLAMATSCQKSIVNKDMQGGALQESKKTRQAAGKKISDSSKSKFEILVKVYSEFLDSADQVNLYWKDGTVMQIDDGIMDKSHEEMLDNSDIEDMLSQIYVSGELSEDPPLNFEPGRIRYEPFFKKIFGENESEVRARLVDVQWVDGSQILFSSVNGASDSLKLVIQSLKELPSEFDKYLVNIGGTFVWRNIANTNRLSNHSFGTSIDINTKYTDYWQWNKNLNYRNRIPFEIVEIFEKYGFIWGGKWYHYDTMHFEFRPELILTN
jgi:peptidoglycan L-alanyl-D-glutamate endopeptidase CwlK